MTYYMGRDFHRPGRSEVLATEGMCATSHPLATSVAVDLLRQGGNAMDAAIGAAILLGFCEPQMAGLGGDCFVLFQEKPGAAPQGYNGSGRAPAKFDAAALREQGHKIMPLYDAAAVTIPGAVEAFVTLHNDHGKLPLDQLLAPAIHYARAGVPIAPRVMFDWGLTHDNLQEASRAKFMIDGQLPEVGRLFKAERQADILELIAKKGSAGFYEGEVAQDMVASLNAFGGVHELEDFASHKGEYVTPISGQYAGHDLVELPPNGQGATALLMAGILEAFDLSKADPFGADRAHLEAEAARMAYGMRNRIIADPNHSPAALDEMLSPDVAKKLAAKIDPKRASKAGHPLPEAHHKDTVYLTVVDRNQMSVSLIYSIFHSFGSGIGSEKFDILFHNRGAGFTLQEGHPNEAKGGKRPLHTIIPGMLMKDGNALMPFGVMGGAYQPNGHMRLISNLLDFDMSLQAAIDAPRSFAEGDVVQIEEGYPKYVRETLFRRGHFLSVPKAPIGGAQAIWIDHERGLLIGGSDPRKDGCALGY